MEIRRLTPADAPGVLETLTALLQQLRTPSTTLTPEYLAAILKNDDVFLFAAFHEGSLAGTLTLARSPLLSGIRAHIEDVVVDERFRRRGIAAALVEHALQAANALYPQLGFLLRETNVYRYASEGSR